MQRFKIIDMNSIIKIIYLTIGIFVLILISSCDEKEVLIPEYVLPDTDRVVLIEELTGVRCPNCPGGSAELKRLKEQFGDNLAIVGIHSSILATPYNNSKYDFRAPFNDQIQDYLGLPIGKPSAYINRRFYPGENNRAIPTIGSWASYVAAELESFSQLVMGSEHIFNPESRQLDFSVDITAKELLDGRFRLTVYLIESGIIDPQLDQTLGLIEEYEHNYVLREVLSEVTGDILPDVLNPGQPIIRNFNFILPQEEGWWNASNMSVIAFVTSYDTDDTDNREVLQVVQFDLL
jgi:hypothetical protein